MAHIIKVSRNNSWVIYAVLILAVLAIVLIPTRSVNEEKIVISEELVERVELKAVEVEQIVSSTTTEEKRVEKFGPLPYEAAGTTLESETRDGEKYAQQDWKITFEEEIDDCINYTYRLYRRDSLVDIEDDVVCFNDQKTQVVSIEAEYSGSLEALKFNLTLEAPLGTYYVTEKVEIENSEPVMVTTYENVTIVEPRNVSRTINETKKVNWLFGFSWG